MAVTSEDVARLAGVSTATVSRVLSGSPRISAKTAARVQRAVAELRYEPNVLAQGLARQHTRNIALGIFPENTGPTTLSRLGKKPWYFYMDVLLSMESEANEQGYDLLLPSRSASTPHDYVRSLRQRKVAGAIMIALPASDARIQAMLEVDLPTVFVDLIAEGPRATCVRSDNMLGSYAVVRHLLELGHRRFALYTGPSTWLLGAERLLGTRQALESAGVPIDPGLIRSSGFEMHEAYETTLSLLDERRDFTCIVAPSDFIAVGALRALHERGVRIPEDVSVAGADDIDLCLYVDPELTSVRRHPAAIGRGAIRRLLDLVNGSDDRTPLVVPTELVVRNSTGPAPQARTE